MLRSIKNLKDYHLTTKEGSAGKIEDFYFDGNKWTVNFLVADIGHLWRQKKVLLSPAAFYGKANDRNRTFPVVFPLNVMLQTCPGVESENIVSKDKTDLIARYPHWPQWAEDHPGKPPIVGYIDEITEELKQIQKTEKSNLRSINEIIGYHIQTLDGTIGHISDFIIDDDDWTIRFLIVSTKNWLPSKEVLVVPVWVDAIRWYDRKVFIHLTRENLKESPTYHPDSPITEQQEEMLFDYYGRPKSRV